MRRLILRSFQSPGDIVMLTAAVRDLHLAAPGAFQTDIRTSCDALWENNPYLSRLSDGEPGVESIDVEYPLIHQSNDRPYHFIHGYAQFLEDRLGVRIPVTKFTGDIHLSPDERRHSLPDLPEHYWILIGGGKYDFTAKWWNPASYQAVVDHFRGVIPFVQCGEAGHWHPPLEGVTNLIGRTSLRQFVQLMHHAEGVVAPVTFAMHLAAAVETPRGRPPHRPCVVIAGGREPMQWEAYPHHQFLSTNGMLSCCAHGGCWKSRCQLVGDGDDKDTQHVCEQPVPLRDDLRIPRCMDMIQPADVIRRIEMYLEGGAWRRNGRSPEAHLAALPTGPATRPEVREAVELPVVVSAAPEPPPATAVVPKTRNVLLGFKHGLGDAVQFTIVLQHLQAVHPEWNVDIETQVGKHSAFRGLCRHLYLQERHESPPCCEYHQRITIDWHEMRDSIGQVPSTKPTRCLQEVFQITPRPELFRYSIGISDTARQLARDYLHAVCPSGPNADGRFATVLLHYEGNTSTEQKNLSHDLARQVCNVVLDAGYVPLILDWDRRSPLPDGRLIHCPHEGIDLWHREGTGDAETLAALIEQSTLMIGVDSGPLHVAGATTTPTLGVWTDHHPVHYFDLADNVTHLVPSDHERRTGPAGQEYFRSHYQSMVYQNLAITLPAVVQHRLTGESLEQLLNKQFLGQLRATGYTEAYYEEHRNAGLDYLGFGDWQQRYGRWLKEVFGWHGRRVLDVGCACGSIARGFQQAGVQIRGVDLSEAMIHKGRAAWPELAASLFVCDAVNLHVFKPRAFDGLHSAQSAEHWHPDLVPFILRELARVTVPGGLFFCCLDTSELFARQGRSLATEDPTHVCIQPMSWWHERLAETGWTVETPVFAGGLREHPESFLGDYDWDWFIARRQPSR